MYQNCISRHFSNQSIEFLKLATCPLRSSPIDWGELSGAGFSADVTTERDWNSVDAKWLWGILQSSGHHEHDAENDETKSWLSCQVTLNQRCFAFIRPHTPLVYRYHVISQTQSHSAVFGCSPSGWMPGAAPTVRHLVVDSWATSVLVGLNMYRAGGTDWGKNKV